MSMLEFFGLILVLSLFTYAVLIVANVIDKKTEEENPVVFGKPEHDEDKSAKINKRKK